MPIFAQVILFAFAVTFGLQAEAENYLVYFGGGESSKSGDQMFDSSLKQNLAYGNASGWKSEYHYRKDLPPDLSPDDQGKVKNDFSPQTFNKKIKDLTIAIKEGKIKPGEQLLVYIDTHGGINEDGKYFGVSDPGDVDLEKLKFLIRAAEKKGVKLGIVGATCYSGSLMKYRSPNTCLITLTQPDKVGFYGDGQILRLLNPSKSLGKKNLEELYLETREHTDPFWIKVNEATPSQPMISTNAGIAADEMLSPLKKNIVDEFDRDAILGKQLCKNPSLAVMTLDKNFQDTKITVSGLFIDSEAEALPLLKEKIDEFNTLQNQMIAYNVAKKEEACTWPAGKNGSSLNLQSNICLDAGDIDYYVNKYYPAKEIHFSPKGTSLDKRTKASRNIERLLSLQDSNAYKNFKRLEKENKKTLDRLDDLSREIARIERQVYAQAYKKVSEKDKEPNPCRDFKL